MTMLKGLLAAAVSVAGLTAASNADAAVTINIMQAGADVTLSASGTFNTALATVLGAGSNFSNAVRANPGFIGFGTQSSTFAYAASGPTAFGTSSTIFAPATNIGIGIGVNAFSSAFFIAQSYVSNAQIATLGVVNNTTLAAMGFTTGVYNFTVGGNALTVNVGQLTPAVPEPASWAMMILGMGVAGAALRRRKVSVRVSYAA